MGLIFKQKEDEVVKSYQSRFASYISNLNDEIQVNKIFTELTILNIKLDKNDGIFSKIKDYLKKNNNISKKDYIMLQFDDLMKVSKKYNQSQHEMINNVMHSFLPTQEKNAWETFWDAFDKATGRK